MMKRNQPVDELTEVERLEMQACVALRALIESKERVLKTKKQALKQEILLAQQEYQSLSAKGKEELLGAILATQDQNLIDCLDEITQPPQESSVDDDAIQSTSPRIKL